MTLTINADRQDCLTNVQSNLLADRLKDRPTYRQAHKWKGRHPNKQRLPKVRERQTNLQTLTNRKSDTPTDRHRLPKERKTDQPTD